MWLTHLIFVGLLLAKYSRQDQADLYSPKYVVDITIARPYDAPPEELGKELDEEMEEQLEEHLEQHLEEQVEQEELSSRSGFFISHTMIASDYYPEDKINAVKWIELDFPCLGPNYQNASFFANQLLMRVLDDILFVAILVPFYASDQLQFARAPRPEEDHIVETLQVYYYALRDKTSDQIRPRIFDIRTITNPYDAGSAVIVWYQGAPLVIGMITQRGQKLVFAHIWDLKPLFKKALELYSIPKDTFVVAYYTDLNVDKLYAATFVSPNLALTVRIDEAERVEEIVFNFRKLNIHYAENYPAPVSEIAVYQDRLFCGIILPYYVPGLAYIKPIRLNAGLPTSYPATGFYSYSVTIDDREKRIYAVVGDRMHLSSDGYVLHNMNVPVKGRTYGSPIVARDEDGDPVLVGLNTNFIDERNFQMSSTRTEVELYEAYRALINMTRFRPDEERKDDAWLNWVDRLFEDVATDNLANRNPSGDRYGYPQTSFKVAAVHIAETTELLRLDEYDWPGVNRELRELIGDLRDEFRATFNAKQDLGPILDRIMNRIVLLRNYFSFL